MQKPDPTPWPPAPPTGETETAKKPVSRIAGWVSLCLAVVGILAILPYWLIRHIGWVEAPSPELGMVWWCAALGSGIVGRRSVPGKIGISLSLAVIVAVAILIVWMVARPPVAPVSAPSIPPPRLSR